LVALRGIPSVSRSRAALVFIAMAS
jgi:hypothetical protein